MTSPKHHQVEVDLGDKSYTLTCTPAAALAICDRFGGVQPAIQAVAAMNARAMANVIRAGANLKDRDSRELDEAVAARGVAELGAPLIEFLGALLRGGRPLPKPGEDLEREQPQGNA